MPIDSATALQELRIRAERQRLASESLPSHTSPEVQRLVQELQMHQLELEMQCEELLRAEADAENSRAQYRDLYDFAPVGYCSLDAKGVVCQLNLRTSQVLGQVRQQLLGRRLALFVAPADRVAFADLLTQLWEQPGQRLTLELAMRRADDTPFFAQLAGIVTADDAASSEPATCRLMLLDITERRLATDAIAASEARFHSTFEQSIDGMVLIREQCFVDVNAAVLRLLGLHRREAIVGHAVTEFWPARQPNGQRSADMLARCLTQASTKGWCRLEWQRYNAQGQPVWDELSFNPVVVQGQALLHAAWRDITERKLSEQRLQQSQEHLQRALAATSTGTWSYDMATRLLRQDARAQAIFGLPTPEVPFEELLAYVHPGDQARMGRLLAQARAERATFDLEHRLLLPDGSVRYVAVSGQFSYDEPTQTTQCLNGLVRDITRRRESQQQLDYKNQLLDNMLQHLPVVLCRLDAAGCYQEIAGSGLRRLGLADNAVLGHSALRDFPSEAAHIRQLLAGESLTHAVQVRQPHQTVYFHTYSFFDPEQQEAIVLAIDVTESELLKREVARQTGQQQQQVLAAALTAQEEERRRIAESLHNGLGQLLYGTRLHLDLLPKSEAVHKVQELLSEAIRTTRTLSFELTPGVLEDFGLAVALGELTKRIPPQQLRVDLNLGNLARPLPQPLQIATYRIVQELLNNVMKHAQAREVFVQVTREEDVLYISVEDDGIGFDPNQELHHKGIGMAGIRTRTGLLSGTFTIKSRLGYGTGAFLALPVGS